jgi:hypothetical protein
LKRGHGCALTHPRPLTTHHIEDGEMAQPIVSRQEAKARGLSWFYTGKPCKRGHTDRRNTCNSTCLSCARIRKNEYYRRNAKQIVERQRERPGHKEYQARYRADNRDRLIAHGRKFYRENRIRLIARAKGISSPSREMPDRCECCSREAVGSLHLDHCHESGTFRGWLCRACNSAIGMLGDNITGLMMAVTYLQRSSEPKAA